MTQDPRQEAYKVQAEALETTEPELSKPNWNSDFFGQRGKQRDYLFRFAVTTSSLSLLFLIAIVISQTILRLKVSPHFEIVDNRGLEILAVSVFGQVFGVIYVIAKSLWSNDEFKLMNNERKE